MYSRSGVKAILEGVVVNNHKAVLVLYDIANLRVLDL